MNNNLFDQLVLSIKEADAIKSGEIQANRIKNLRAYPVLISFFFSN